ncbi:sugar ABC transporter permease [Paenibacillus sp. 598K]|uniref:carbohydrate ABC transporter permease n=1 Tax=Paenibacillus sp. 598K TaxID=1117987 RepID=UPI000FFAD301|nr:carbohydrate ABC transporter permease [Paenibacillus sp. 598K]GBF76644.1 sugar ABC transporter permease [Paenibacillus sp. 598K]
MKPAKRSLFPIVNTALLLGLVAATVYPFLYMAAISLSDPLPVLKGQVWLLPKGWNFEAYSIVLGDQRIGRAYLNTVLYVALGTCLSLIVTSAGAYALSRKDLAGHRVMMAMIIFTMFFGGGMIPTFLTVRSLGLVDTIWAMVVPGIVSTWNLIVMRTFFSGIPKELEESGKVDGLNDITLFIRIVIPLSKAVFATVGLFYAVHIWNNFYTPLLYLRDQNLFPLQVIVRDIVLAGQVNNSDATSVGGDALVIEDSLKFATILITTLPILLVYPFLQKHFVKGALVGAVKG